jgi:hypothetical protein
MINRPPGFKRSGETIQKVVIVPRVVEGFKEDDAIELLVRESFTEQSALAFNIETIARAWALTRSKDG